MDDGSERVFRLFNGQPQFLSPSEDQTSKKDTKWIRIWGNDNKLFEIERGNMLVRTPKDDFKHPDKWFPLPAAEWNAVEYSDDLMFSNANRILAMRACFDPSETLNVWAIRDSSSASNRLETLLSSPKTRSFAVSPSGKYAAYVTGNDDMNVKSLETGALLFHAPGRWEARIIGFIGDDYLVVQDHESLELYKFLGDEFRKQQVFSTTLIKEMLESPLSSVIVRGNFVLVKRTESNALLGQDVAILPAKLDLLLYQLINGTLHEVNQCAVSLPNDTMDLSVSEIGTAAVWSKERVSLFALNPWKEMAELRVAKNAAIENVSLSPSGSYMAIWIGNRIELYQISR